MTITVTIQLFGAFRTHKTATIAIEMQAPSTVLALKQLIANKLIDTPLATLVTQSVLATENAVLADEDICDHSCQLAILPPVCGG